MYTYVDFAGRERESVFLTRRRGKFPVRDSTNSNSNAQFSFTLLHKNKKEKKDRLTGTKELLNLDSIPRSVAWKTQSPVAHLSLMFRVFARMIFPKLREPFFRSVCFCGEFLYVHRIYAREKRSSHSKSIGKLCTSLKNVHLSLSFL